MTKIAQYIFNAAKAGEMQRQRVSGIDTAKLPTSLKEFEELSRKHQFVEDDEIGTPSTTVAALAS